MLVPEPALAQLHAYGIFALMQVGGDIVGVIQHPLVVIGPAGAQGGVPHLASV